jgi:peptidoglycan/LPS O-acetylase OafA/YrhL
VCGSQVRHVLRPHMTGGAPASPPALVAAVHGEGTRNNFDLLRLLAAFQVFYFHSNFHLRIPVGDIAVRVNEVVDFFPGVPIFFVISGFLISRSYERSRTLGAYARNRFLRIYPALWVCFLVSLAMLAAVGFLQTTLVATPRFAVWVAAQLTLFQVYNPDFLRSFGMGVLNGSLWTIPVELGFYVALPIVYAVVRRLPRAAGDLVLGAIALVSYSVWHFAINHPGHDTVLWVKMLLVSPAAYFYMFLFGVLFHRRFEQVRRLFEGRLLLWSVAYLALMLLQDAVFGPARKTSYPLVLMGNLTLAFWTMSFAFTGKTLSERILRGNDISYGLYIYHALVLNVLIHYGAIGRPVYVILAGGVSLSLAAFSWRLIESPVLKLKKRVRPPAAEA